MVSDEMMEPKEVVMAYVKALDSHDFDLAASLIDENVRIRGPAGESFGNPGTFVNMLKKYSGKYDIKKSFVDGSDVCLLYDYVISGRTVYMSSWYQVKSGKIVLISTVFDPSAFD